MIFIICPQCKLALHVVGDDAETHQLFGEGTTFAERGYACPRCTGGMAAYGSLPSNAGFNPYTLSPQEAFAALNGLGMPEEKDCVPEVIRTEFKKSVKSLAVRWVRGTNRSIIDHIEFEDGTKMYLGASPQGAIVYRISPPFSYTEEALRDIGSSG
jgi:hypothetical protein